MKYYVIIVAAGSGKRMNSATPKQFLLLDSRPVLMHTINAFYHSDVHPDILVVLNEQYLDFWAGLCSQHNFTVPHKTIKGGTQRFDSVKNALTEIDEGTSIIAIHDAVRPLISKDLIKRSFKEAEKKGNAVPGIPSRNSLRQLTEDGSLALNRDRIFEIQTPQVFESGLLKRAYNQQYSDKFTDDASVVEKIGSKINIITGEPYNIKITYPDDVKIAKLLLKA
jgi:2-C-methyl-D-erythritol 4-phosphate cytidylyltransferase